VSKFVIIAQRFVRLFQKIPYVFRVLSHSLLKYEIFHQGGRGTVPLERKDENTALKARPVAIEMELFQAPHLLLSDSR
jgi:hypothetical protein